MLTIDDISKQTGLKYSFLIKCLNRSEHLKPILKLHVSRGANNSWLFKSGAYAIFGRIKDLKEQGMNLPEIAKNLESDLKHNVKSIQTDHSNVSKPEAKPDKPKAGQGSEPNLLQKIFDLQGKLNQEIKNRLEDQKQSAKAILDLSNDNAGLSTGLKLLTDGKTPEEVQVERAEARKQEKERMKIVADLKNSGFLRFRKRKKLLEKLDELI